MCIRDSLYTFAYNSTLSDANIFSTYIGQQRLCLDAADYEYLLEKYGREALSAYTARIRDLEETITNLQGALSVQPVSYTHLDVYKRQIDGDGRIPFPVSHNKFHV